MATTLQVETQVKNTFIEMPSTPSGATPVPSPMASAPAKTSSAWSLKESLIQAAAEEPQAPTVQAQTLGGVGVAVPRAVVQRRLKGRPGPRPLEFGSTSSMMSIPESPSVGVAQQLMVRKDAVKYISSSSSIPPTPAALCEISITPTGTPANFATYPSVGMYAVPDAATAPGALGPASRTTLSLVDMIQSPKAEEKAGMLQNAFQQYYTAVPQQASASSPPTVTLAPQAPLQFSASSGAPKVLPAPMPPPPLYQPNVIAPATPTAAPAGIALGFPGVAQASAEPTSVVPPASSAAVALGLVTQASPAAVAPAPLAVGTLPVSYSAPPAAVAPTVMPAAATLPPQAMPSAMPSTMPSATVIMGAPPAMSQVTFVQTQPTLQPAPVMGMPPPPPLAPAPMVTGQHMPPPMYSPQANSSPVSSLSAVESDMKVLIDMAVASGNQKAIDALQRQAMQSGMSEEQFRALLSPGSPTVVMSTSPVSR